MRVEITLLGGFDLQLDGRHLGADLMRRRDAANLIKVLALARGRRLHREQLMTSLWPDAPAEVLANRLHKAAHLARKATNVARAVVLANTSVSLFPDDDVTIDVDQFDRLATAALATPDQRATTAALAAYSGELLPLDPYDDWAFNARQRLQLRYRELLRRAGRHDELVALDPTDEDAHVGLMRSLLLAGDRTGVLRQYDSLAAILDRELGLGPSIEARSVRDLALGPSSAAQPAEPTPPRAATLATQRLGFCRAVDGVRLAYATCGQGPPLVKVSNWLSHLDHEWESPIWRHWWTALSERATLVRYDERGCGLSDWDVDRSSFTLDAWVRDLETVVDALGLERFPLLGLSQGGPIAITYAARHPERVSHIVVVGTCARATWERADDAHQRELLALGELITTSWGSDQPGFRQIYDARFLPDGPLDLWRAFDELQRRSTSARNALRLWRAFGSLDCSDAAARIDVPTLILHARGDMVWPFEEAEDLHHLVSGSRLVELASRNHILQADEPAFATMIDEIGRFLAWPP